MWETLMNQAYIGSESNDAKILSQIFLIFW